jgi:hypothetical protein
VFYGLHTAQHSQELEMKTLAMVTLSLAVLASSSAFAQGKTRAQVYQELIEAQQNGLNYVTDTSYPDVNPIYAPLVARMKAERLAQQNAAAHAKSGAASAGSN